MRSSMFFFMQALVNVDFFFSFLSIPYLQNDSNGETVTNNGRFDHLTITKTDTFNDLMEAILRFEKNTKCIDETNHSEAQAEVRKVSKKLKALNFRASLLKIGIWEVIFII